ncbi:hypothetical protein HK102_011670 [Quaeritorhiza haematococci]|nr:hypothetical protein HK102_011670 [Quaeritorhiza haematococci]
MFRKKVAKVFRCPLKLGRKRARSQGETCLTTTNDNRKIEERSIQAPDVENVVGPDAMVGLDRHDFHSELSRRPLQSESEYPGLAEVATTETLDHDGDGSDETVAVAEPLDTPTLTTPDADPVHAFEDPILQKLLSKRQKMMDVSEDAEMERQRRMYNMLRHSHHYKKLQVEDANARWGSAMADLELALAGGVDDGSGTSASVAEKRGAEGVGEVMAITGTDGGVDAIDLEDLALAAASNFVTGIGASFPSLPTRPPLVASVSAVTSKTQAQRVSFSETITIIPPREFPDNPTECEEGGDDGDHPEVEGNSDSDEEAAKNDMVRHPAAAARDVHPKLLLARKGNNEGLHEEDPALCGDDHVAQRQHADAADDLRDFGDAVATRSSSSSVSSSRSSLSSLHTTTTHPPIEEVGEADGFGDGNEKDQTDSAGVNGEADASSVHDRGTMMRMKPPLPPSALNLTAPIAQTQAQVAKKRWFRGSIGRDPLLDALDVPASSPAAGGSGCANETCSSQSGDSTPTVSSFEVDVAAPSPLPTIFPPLPLLPISLSSCRTSSASTNITSSTSGTDTTAVEEQAPVSRPRAPNSTRWRKEEQTQKGGSSASVNPFKKARAKLVNVLSKLHLFD